jgi:hypothetical protein
MIWLLRGRAGIRAQTPFSAVFARLDRMDRAIQDRRCLRDSVRVVAKSGVSRKERKSAVQTFARFAVK